MRSRPAESNYLPEQLGKPYPPQITVRKEIYLYNPPVMVSTESGSYTMS